VTRIVHAGLSWLFGWLNPVRGKLIAAAIAFLVLGAVASSRLQVVNEYVGVLPPGKTLDATRALERQLTGVVPLAVLLEGAPGAMERPDVLAAIDAVDRFAERQPHVNFSASLADLVAEIHRAFDPAAIGRTPASQALVSQYLSLVDPEERLELVNGDGSRSHIRVFIDDPGSPDFSALRTALERELQARFAPLGVKATLTGNGVLAYAELDEMVREVLWGFVLAFAIIIAAEWLAFRSFRIAALSVLPNLLPVIACFVVMRLCGLNFRVDTSLVLSVSIGGLFNTTIHIVARILQQLRAGQRDPDAIVRAALLAVGPPSLFTALILSIGFAVIAMSEFPGLRNMGLLSVVTLLTGFVSDAVLTTALMRSYFNWQPPSKTTTTTRDKETSHETNLDPLAAPAMRAALSGPGGR
jgi:predicted RND superfamily exporter protein